MERGYAKTSIGAIESAAGLAPRAGAFYRHFASKQALVVELARTKISETPDEFDFERLKEFGNTRSELIAIAQTYEAAARRQAPYMRLIEEIRITETGAAFESQLNEELLGALMGWVASKPAARRYSQQRLAALTMSIFGGWLFYLVKLQQGVDVAVLDRDVLLNEWATLWANMLDRSR